MPEYRVRPEDHRVADGSTFSLSGTDTFLAPEELDRDSARKLTKKNRDRFADLQELLYAEGKQALLIVLQAMDTGGKDSTIRAVTKGVNPQGFHVFGFKAPSKRELSHDYLWRIHQQVPPKGRIGIFNRSHYEDVLIVKVHRWATPETIEDRYRQINDFERLLSESGTRILKIMLHISKDYQLARLRRRLMFPEKHWKFNPDDLKERKLWTTYMSAYETAIQRCSSEAAPWYVIPAEQRWYRNLVISQLIVDTLAEMAPEYPPPAFDPADYPPETLQ
jgi:PPK2 family polyphosphate:nucleotide phosphotransferase